MADVADVDDSLVMIDFTDDAIIPDTHPIRLLALKSAKKMMRIFSCVVQLSQHALLQASGQNGE